MNSNKKDIWKFLNIICAVLFLVIAAYFVINDVYMLNRWNEWNEAQKNNFYSTFLAYSAIVAAFSYVIVAIMLLMRVNKAPLLAGFAVAFILNVIACSQYKLYEFNYDYSQVAYLEVICKAEVTPSYNMYLLESLSLAVMIVYIILANLKSPGIKRVCNRIWFVPAAAKLSTVIYGFYKMSKMSSYFCGFGTKAYWRDMGSYFQWNIYAFVIVLAYLILGLWIVKSRD